MKTSFANLKTCDMAEAVSHIETYGLSPNSFRDALLNAMMRIHELEKKTMNCPNCQTPITERQVRSPKNNFRKLHFDA